MSHKTTSSSRSLALFRAGVLLGVGLLRPELNVAVLTKRTSLDKLALLPHQVLDCDLIRAEDAQMVADYVAVAALWASNQSRAVMVALLGHIVVRAMAARDASEGQLVVRLLGLGSLALALCASGLGALFGIGLWRLGERIARGTRNGMECADEG